MAPFAGSKRRSIQVAGVSALVAMALLAGGCSSRTTPDASQSPSAGLAKGLEVDPSSDFGLPKPLGLEPIVRPETVVLDAKDSPVDSAIILNERECLPTDPERSPWTFD